VTVILFDMLCVIVDCIEPKDKSSYLTVLDFSIPAAVCSVPGFHLASQRSTTLVECAT